MSHVLEISLALNVNLVDKIANMRITHETSWVIKYAYDQLNEQIAKDNRFHKVVFKYNLDEVQKYLCREKIDFFILKRESIIFPKGSL